MILSRPMSLAFMVMIVVWVGGPLRAQSLPAAQAATQHPALFLVGDSIMKTGTPPGNMGPWGMGYELIPMFDAKQVHVYNEGAGGRSSRGYIQEGLWKKVVDRIEPGDFVVVMFGHNDGANSQAYPDRMTLKGSGEETQENTAADGKKVTVHTYGWYMQQYAREGKAKGATVIILSPVTRNTWVEGKIKRGFDGYVQWAADAAKASGALYIDLNALAADRYDALGQQAAARYFNDTQHSTKTGARLHAEAVIAGLRQFKDLELIKAIALPAATGAAATAENARVAARPGAATDSPATARAFDLQPFVFKGNQDAEQDSAKTPRTGKVLLVLAGDSTVTYSAGYAAGLRAQFDKELQVINLSRGGRTTATFRSDGRWQQMLDLKPDYVMIQFGHNDSAYLTLDVYTENLIRYVDEARAAGVTPILVTPISRRYWRADGKIHSDLIAHADAMKKIAVDKKVPLMDLHARSIEYYEAVGQKVTDTWSNTKANPALTRSANPSTLPATVLDYTHFNAEGSRAIGRVVADELKRAVPALAPYVN